KEKSGAAELIGANARDILDVGCANGVITKGIAHRYPEARVHGIDLDDEFITEAARPSEDDHAPEFERVYLREILERPRRYDAVTFMSVLHEFYSYGNREPSVMKAVADAYELLNPGGKLVIRDMILPERMKTAEFPATSIANKIRANSEVAGRLAEFEAMYGPIDTLYNANHFLLKYMYEENWERELPENYVPVSTEQYRGLFDWLGAETTHAESYLIPYLRDKWQADFGLTEGEMLNLYSTTILVAEKPQDAIPMSPSK
ncbi:MAG: class I SAM-dependent methyltransferase, partial [Candidatus Pacebacteria bacterium]|nr:class I SAM-dependent methyltransferase [Candidatus Paceibacterota bacterium]